MITAHLTYDDYAKILGECIRAWNRGDAEAVASFYTDDLDYRDPSVPKGIKNKRDFIDYLRLTFSVWPEQQWVIDETFIHNDKAACTGTYRFRIANDKSEITGNGADIIEFRGDKIQKNYVYLNADKWNSWLKKRARVITQEKSSGDEGLAELFRGASDAVDWAVPPERRPGVLI